MARALDPRRLAQLEARYGRVLARHAARGQRRDLGRYRDDPVGFAHDVLRATLYDRQIELLEAVRDHDRVAVRGANAVGKDHAAAIAALWWTYTRPGGLVLITGPTQRQVDEIVFGREIRTLWRRAKLPGQLLTRALRTSGDAGADDDVDELTGDLRSGILGFVSNDLSRLTGHHAPHVLCIVTEAQGVADIVFDSLFNNATGPGDRLLAVANPTEPSGRFFKASQPGSGWVALRIPATDHPNVKEGRQIIPGGPSRAWLERLRQEEGEGSRFWQVFVEAEFPATATDALVTRAWVEAAFARWAGDRTVGNEHEPVVGLDVARTGGDLCAAAPLRGAVVYPIETWEPDPANPTADAVDRAIAIMRAHGGRPEGDVHGLPRGRFIVDVALMGGGVVDGLRGRGWAVIEFNGSRRPEEADQPERYENLRAYGYWALRQAFVGNVPVVAPDERVLDELLATRYEAGTREGVKIVRKGLIRAALGRSPDRTDALMMGWLEANAPGAGGGTAPALF